MSHRQGFTLLEILVVLIIIAIAIVMALPSFTTPTEQARAQTARNNLLAIYSAQKNYRNNNGNFAVGASGLSGDTSSLSAINSTLSLNIQDDGTYNYSCAVPTGSICTAARANPPGNLTMQITLTMPVNLRGINLNPTCAGNASWCP